MITVVRVVA